MVTLTYPAEFPAPKDHAVYKGHLHTLQIYLRRQWPECSGIWKLEFQARGAAHYHLMLFGLAGHLIEIVRAWVRDTWYRIAHKGDEFLGKAGTQVDAIKSVAGAACYLVKYINKGDQTMPGNFSGRYWGKISVKHLPAVKPRTLELEEKRAFQIRRLARKKIQKDVEASRWKRFLKERNEQFWRVGGRLFWETLKSARHGTKPQDRRDGDRRFQALEWTFKDERPIEIDGKNFHPLSPWQTMAFPLDYARKDAYRQPKRYKLRNNARVRLLCDASEFTRQVVKLPSR